MTVEHLLLCRQLEGERKVRNKSGEDLSECREGRKGTKKDESGHCGLRRVGRGRKCSRGYHQGAEKG